jgi:hypothetical protein
MRTEVGLALNSCAVFLEWVWPNRAKKRLARHICLASGAKNTVHEQGWKLYLVNKKKTRGLIGSRSNSLALTAWNGKCVQVVGMTVR